MEDKITSYEFDAAAAQETDINKKGIIVTVTSAAPVVLHRSTITLEYLTARHDQLTTELATIDAQLAEAKQALGISDK